MEKGKIIFLNGVMGTGKTTLAKTLQQRLADPFFLLSLDTFIGMSPEKYFSDPKGITIMNKAVSILPHTAQIFSDMGNNIIIDHVLLKRDNNMQECVELLHEYPVLFVHVTCPLVEHHRRIRERGRTFAPIDEQISAANGQLFDLIPQDTYDLTIDTTKKDYVEQIIELINYPEKFTAFKTLWSQRTV